MTYEQLEAALRATDGVKVGEGVSEAEVVRAESRIGKIPGEYRRFLCDFGWVEFAHYEIFGLGDSIMRGNNLVEVTRDERSYGRIRKLVPVMNDGAGNLYCVDQKSKAPESPVVMSTLDSDPDYVVDADGFSHWLLDLIRST